MPALGLFWIKAVILPNFFFSLYFARFDLEANGFFLTLVHFRKNQLFMYDLLSPAATVQEAPTNGSQFIFQQGLTDKIS